MTVSRQLALALALGLPMPVAAQSFENIAALEQRLVAELGAGIGDQGGPVAPIDRRLKLARCTGAVVIDPPNLGAAALRCAALGWRIRVPLIRESPEMQTAAREIVIRKGDPVELVAGGRYFSVSSQAIAEQDGHIGGRIRVRTTPKSPPMMVEIVRAGVVRIPGT